MKRIRLINEKSFASIASILAGTQAVLLLLQLVIDYFVDRLSGASLSLVYFIGPSLTILFYIFICNNFYKAKENFIYAKSAVCSLLLCDYVLAVILNIVTIIQMIFVSFSIGSIIVLLPLVAGTIYFINFFIYFRKKKNENIKWMIISGIALLVIGLFNCVSDIIEVVSVIKTVSQYLQGTIEGLLKVVYCLVSCLLVVSTFSLSSIYVWYALVIKKGY